MKKHSVKVKNEHLAPGGQRLDELRLDKFMAAAMPEMSRGLARKKIELGSVYLNRKRCRMAGRTLRVGDVVELYETENPVTPEAPLPTFALTAAEVLFEDADYIVVNKPAGLPTHGTIDQNRYHLVLAVQKYLAANAGVATPDTMYVGLHHRLDRDTSGVILFTKRKEANATIAHAFQERKVEKTYLAVALSGASAVPPDVIKSYLGRDPHNKRRYCSVRSGGQYAETAVRVVASQQREGKTLHLVEAKPMTGRTHQIRVHLSENQLPILGDMVYGVAFPGVPRLLLHAWRLEIGGNTWLAPFPADFAALDFQAPQA